MLLKIKSRHVMNMARRRSVVEVGGGEDSPVFQKLQFFEGDAFKDKHHWKKQCIKFEHALITARKENVVLRRALAAITKDPDMRERFGVELGAMHEALDELKAQANKGRARDMQVSRSMPKPHSDTGRSMG